MEFGPDTLDSLPAIDASRSTLIDADAATPIDLGERADLAIEDDHFAAARRSPIATPQPKPFQPRHLSPSSTSLYQQCARKWKFRYLDRLPDPPGEAALAGTFAHRVLELLLQLPASDRTIDQAKRLARQAWPETEDDTDFQALGLTDESARLFRWRGWQAVEGLWRIEDPQKVQVHATEHDVQVDIDGVPFRGIIDRVEIVNDQLVISDYKSGRAPSARFADERLTQVLLYAAAVHAATQQRPVKARLLYLGQTIIDIDVTDENLGEAVELLTETWASLCHDCERQEFDTTTGPLCAWCPFVAHCEDGQAEVQKRLAAGRVRSDAPALLVLPEAS